MAEKETNPKAKILILGGIKSGKSRLALKIASQFSGPRFFVATAEPFDEEMARKIAAHRKERGQSWHTLEAPVELPNTLRKLPSQGVCLVDCLTVWLGNLWHYQKDLETYCEDLLKAIEEMKIPCVFVSNEVGLGIMPAEKAGKTFAEKLGLLNQRVAGVCEEVYLVVAGSPLRLK